MKPFLAPPKTKMKPKKTSMNPIGAGLADLVHAVVFDDFIISEMNFNGSTGVIREVRRSILGESQRKTQKESNRSVDLHWGGLVLMLRIRKTVGFPVVVQGPLS